MKRLISFFVGCFCILFWSTAEVKLQHTANNISIELNKECKLTFKLHNGILLGLQKAQIAGRQIKTDKTCQFPFIAQEWVKDKTAFPFLKFEKIIREKNGVAIVCSVLGTNAASVFRNRFVYAENTDSALNEMPNGLIKELKIKSDSAKSVIQAIYDRDRTYSELKKGIEQQKTLLNATNYRIVEAAESKINQLNKKIAEREKTISDSISGKGNFHSLMHDINIYEDAISKRALEIGQIHRDLYRFAQLRQPSEICSIDSLIDLYDKIGDYLTPQGKLIWHIQSNTELISGWKWGGWKQWYSFQLPDDKKVNVIRQIGTWEIGGTVKDLTVVNMRYRGLGGIEQKINTDVDGNAINPWLTSDILPSLLGKVMAVSPVIPSTISINDRGYALKHRAGAWLTYPARGAGVSFFDFQFKANTGLLSYYEKQGNLRALTEIYPGDKNLSQTDEEWFAMSNVYSTTPQNYLALVLPANDSLTLQAWQTRWHEVNTFIKNKVSDELGFKTYDVLPAIGFNWDYWSKKRSYKRAMENFDSIIPDLQKQGVRQVLNHNAGWINGNSVRLGTDGADSTNFTGSGTCIVYDWKPLPACEEPWKKMYANMNKHDMKYYIWITAMSQIGGGFANEIGYNPKHWLLNSPDGKPNDTYGTKTLKHNISDSTFFRVFTKRLETLKNEYGFDGFWLDSFQNLMMSQLNWADQSGSPLQRPYWEWLANWSRNGVGIMAESQSFPGQSCSIEVPGWESNLTYFSDVCKWLRNSEHKNYTKDQLKELTFKLMSVKGWLAFDILEWSTDDKYTLPNEIMPEFSQFASAYLKALPQMKRICILPDDQGIVWLPESCNDKAVLFAYKKIKKPEGIRLNSLLDDAPVLNIEPFTSYSISGKNLINKFKLGIK